MSGKTKGTSAERELLKQFWNSGWACVRVAGSGSTSYPAPDLVVGNGVRKLAIECKAIRGENKYFSEEEVEQLKVFASLFGAEPWVGVRFDRIGWRFFGVEELKKTPAGHSVSFELAKLKGLVFDELVSN